jgi:hypothetical protein
MHPSIVRSAWREHGQAWLLGASAVMVWTAVLVFLVDRVRRETHI